ncbi:NYN domain-containing protein [Nocardia pseudovaccinii]|uniref:NYN domain-containing protein n=1 Tax=Nocardia pseudovaccinii TaxID=189540 RepID=UPI001FDFA9C6|nr:NYN domain-containing protein [Nocardia pseudovaccinii]
MRLAVLIDADNASPAMAEPLLAEVAKYGTAHVKRAYGDWTSTYLTSWKSQLLKLSIQPVQQFGWTTGRNATDAALIIDAMDLLYSGRFDGFCLVSSDSDFTRLAARLRESGLTVFGIGERKTPRAFVAACDKFVYAENLTAAGQSASAASGERGAPMPGAELVRLVTAAAEAASDEDGWAQLGAVGHYLGKAQPDFDTRTYGYAKLRPLVQALGAFDISQRRPGAGKPAVAYVRRRDRIGPAGDAIESVVDGVDAEGIGGSGQVVVAHALNQLVRLRVPVDQRYRESLLRRVFAAWRDGEADTIGRLEAVIEQHAPDMDKLTRSIAINSLIYEDTAALRVLDPDSAPRVDRRIEPFDGRPEQQWISRGHTAWLAYVVYRLPPDADPAAQLVDTLFDDLEHGRAVLAEAQAIADARKIEAASETECPAGTPIAPAPDPPAE